MFMEVLNDKWHLAIKIVTDSRGWIRLRVGSRE